MVAGDWQNLIQLEVGACIDSLIPANQIKTWISMMWSMWADKAQIAPRLQYYYVKIQCLDFLLGQLRGVYDTGGLDANVSIHQKVDTIVQMRKGTIEERDILLKQTRANRSMQIGTMRRVEPVIPPWNCGQPSPYNPLQPQGAFPPATANGFTGAPAPVLPQGQCPYPWPWPWILDANARAYRGDAYFERKVGT